MNILTPQNAHHGILVRQTATRTLHRLIQLPKYRDWYIAPKGTFKYERLPTEQFHRYEMVEEVPAVVKKCPTCKDKNTSATSIPCLGCDENNCWTPQTPPETALPTLDVNKPVQPPLPPLVALGPDSTELLPEASTDAAGDVLDTLSVMVDDIIRKVEVVLDSHPPVMANWDLLHSALVQLNEAQSLLNPKSEEEQSDG